MKTARAWAEARGSLRSLEPTMMATIITVTAAKKDGTSGFISVSALKRSTSPSAESRPATAEICTQHQQQECGEQAISRRHAGSRAQHAAGGRKRKDKRDKERD